MFATALDMGILFRALVWFGSVHETVFVTKQEGTDVKIL